MFIYIEVRRVREKGEESGRKGKQEAKEQLYFNKLPKSSLELIATARFQRD